MRHGLGGCGKYARCAAGWLLAAKGLLPNYRIRRLVAARLLPERAGQLVKVWAHISLADLMRLDGDSGRGNSPGTPGQDGSC